MTDHGGYSHYWYRTEPASDVGDARVPLESCICRQCYFCPDGWHTDDEMPCACTAACALTDSDGCGGDER